MLIIKPGIFRKYPQLIFGFSTKIGINRKPPYFFNMSFDVGDSSEIVLQNRKFFFKRLELTQETIATQKQVHGDVVSFVESAISCGESDAMITNKPNVGLAISSADCPAIFIFDCKQKVIAAVHSGWRGSQKKILYKVLSKLKHEFNCREENLISYIAPSISQKNYEVGEEVASLFDSRYLIEKNSKYLLDLKKINLDILHDFGLRPQNIQVSSLCTFELKDLLHSYRRDGEVSGRALGVIAMKVI